MSSEIHDFRTRIEDLRRALTEGSSRQTEADAFIITYCPAYGIWEALPLWECEETPEALETAALHTAITQSDTHGSGECFTASIDLRTEEAQAAAGQSEGV